MPVLKTYLGTMQGPAWGLWFVQGTHGDVRFPAAYPPEKGFRLSDGQWWCSSCSGCLCSLWELPDALSESGVTQGCALKRHTEDAEHSLGLDSELCWQFHLRHELERLSSPPRTSVSSFVEWSIWTRSALLKLRSCTRVPQSLAEGQAEIPWARAGA